MSKPQSAGINKRKNNSSYSESYERIPYSVISGSKYAKKGDKAKARETVTSFMKNAKAGNIYQIGGGVGSSGSKFEIVTHRRSPNGLGIKDVGSSRQAIAMTRQNVLSYIKNGAQLLKKKKKR